MGGKDRRSVEPLDLGAEFQDGHACASRTASSTEGTASEVSGNGLLGLGEHAVRDGGSTRSGNEFASSTSGWAPRWTPRWVRPSTQA